MFGCFRRGLKAEDAYTGSDLTKLLQKSYSPTPEFSSIEVLGAYRALVSPHTFMETANCLHGHLRAHQFRFTEVDGKSAMHYKIFAEDPAYFPSSPHGINLLKSVANFDVVKGVPYLPLNVGHIRSAFEYVLPFCSDEQKQELLAELDTIETREPLQEVEHSAELGLPNVMQLVQNKGYARQLAAPAEDAASDEDLVAGNKTDAEHAVYLGRLHSVDQAFRNRASFQDLMSGNFVFVRADQELGGPPLRRMFLCQCVHNEYSERGIAVQWYHSRKHLCGKQYVERRPIRSVEEPTAELQQLPKLLEKLVTLRADARAHAIDSQKRAGTSRRRGDGDKLMLLHDVVAYTSVVTWFDKLTKAGCIPASALRAASARLQVVLAEEGVETSMEGEGQAAGAGTDSESSEHPAPGSEAEEAAASKAKAARNVRRRR